MTSPYELKATLRGHEHAVTVVEYFYVSNEYSPGNRLLTTTLVSGDEQGHLVWWDLMKRRPIVKWKAHGANLLSVKQLGLVWGLEKGDFYVPKYGKLYGLLMTHGRDNTMKIWDLSRVLGQFGPGSTGGSGGSGRPVEMEPVYSEPINSLNFCNVDVYDGRLCSLNRVNGDCFDVSVLKYDSEEHMCSVDPQFEGIDPRILLSKTGKWEHKLGIIMKLVWVSETVLYIGFESGHVISVEIPKDLKSLAYIDNAKIAQLESMFNVENLQQAYLEAANGNTEAISHLVYGDTTSGSHINVLSINSFHYPNPVLDLVYDQKSDKIFATSTGASLVVLNNLGCCNSVGFDNGELVKKNELSFDNNDSIKKNDSRFVNGELIEKNHSRFDNNDSIKKNDSSFVNNDSNKKSHSSFVNNDSFVDSNKPNSPNNNPITNKPNSTNKLQIINKDFHTSINLKSIGASSVAIRLDDLMAITFWNGQVKFYKIAHNKNILTLSKLPFKISKQKPKITKEFSSNPNDPEILASAKQVRRFKTGTVRISTIQSLATMQQLADDYKPKNVADLLAYKKFLKNFRDNWIAIGYDDGCIELYQIQSLADNAVN